MFIERNTREALVIQDISSQPIPEYPAVAIREALVNAVAHADYSLSGTPLSLAIFENRLEIQNPGMLPFGMTIEQVKAGVSRIRNRVIAKIFRVLCLMEEWGSGYQRMVEACREHGYPDPDFQELGTVIRVVLFPHPESRARSAKQTTTGRSGRLTEFS